MFSYGILMLRAGWFCVLCVCLCVCPGGCVRLGSDLSGSACLEGRPVRTTIEYGIHLSSRSGIRTLSHEQKTFPGLLWYEYTRTRTGTRTLIGGVLLDLWESSVYFRDWRVGESIGGACKFFVSKPTWSNLSGVYCNPKMFTSLSYWLMSCLATYVAIFYSCFVLPGRGSFSLFSSCEWQYDHTIAWNWEVLIGTCVIVSDRVM